MANWWEAAPLVDSDEDRKTIAAFAGMKPMIAHTPKSAGNWWDAAPLIDETPTDVGTLNEELHTPPIGIDPRLEPESMMNEAQAAEIPGQILGGMADYAMMATAPTLMGGARAIVTGAARSRIRPIIQGAVMGGGAAALGGGDVGQGALYGAVAGAAGMGPATAARTAAAEAAPEAAALLKVARSASATSAERHAARMALQKMGWVPEAEKAAEKAIETAAPTARKIAPIPDKGNVKPATIFTKPDPVQGPKSLTEMQIVTRGRQEEAAKAANLDLGEVFGSKAAQAAAKHKALMTFGKEVATRNPKVGEKIWMLLDDAGNPVKELTPGEAGAAARKGLKTTWVKNLWTN